MVCIFASDQVIPPLMIHQKKQPSFQDLYKLPVHNCSKVLGILLAFCEGRMPNTHEHKSFLFASIFLTIGWSWWFCGVFSACFVLFEHSMKLRQTAIEKESLQASYSFLLPVTIFGLLYKRCSFYNILSGCKKNVISSLNPSEVSD